MVMRNQYVKPEMVEVEIVISSMLAASLTMNINKTLKGDCEEDFARGRRGVWGDLWADGVEKK